MNSTEKISRELRNIAKRLADDCERVAGKPCHISLFVWTDDRSNYISTLDRPQNIALMEAHIKGWKAGMPDIAAHEYKS